MNIIKNNIKNKFSMCGTILVGISFFKFSVKMYDPCDEHRMFFCTLLKTYVELYNKKNVNLFDYMKLYYGCTGIKI